MKKKLCAIGLATLLLSSSIAIAEIDQTHASFESYGRVLSATATPDGVVIEAEGFFGYHMDENPSMTVRVEIGDNCLIRSATIIGAKAQTAGFDTMLTQAYMDSTYAGAVADPAMETDAVSGATATSQAVRYAVQTAAYYAQTACGYIADTDASDKAELSAVYPAQYETITTDYKVDAQQVGSVLYAADGVAADGSQVLAMKVKSALKFSYKGAAGTGWAASEPSAYTMVIVVDKATQQVCAWKILVDGTKRTQYFSVPQEKIDTYKTVVIKDETVFDAFADGMVLSLEYETEDGEEGPLITGTSIVYTGKTEQGTFSSQLVRNCLRTAAAFYCNH
ncbi:MAG: FMN-binding protein [Clostridia bacterium]